MRAPNRYEIVDRLELALLFIALASVAASWAPGAIEPPGVLSPLGVARFFVGSITAIFSLWQAIFHLCGWLRAMLTARRPA